MAESNELMDAEAWHTVTAKETFNAAWDLIDRNDRTDAEDADLLVVAMASRYHWGQVGGEEQQMVGDWQIAHAASLVGHGSLALRFASSALARAEANGFDDWRLASCYEGMARACATAGDEVGRDKYVQQARAVLETVPDPEDREVVESQLATIPGVVPAR